MARSPKYPRAKPASPRPAVAEVKAAPAGAAKSVEKSAKPMPFVIEPEEASPKASEPVMSKPAVAQPPVAQPSVAQPPVAQPSGAKTAPPISEPKPVAQPEAVVEPEPVAEPIASIEPTPVAAAPEEAVPEKSTLVETPFVEPLTPSTPSQPVVAEPLAAAIESVAFWQTPQVLEGNLIMNEAIETTKKFAEDAKTRVQSMLAEMNDKAKAAMEKSSKAMEEMGDITKGNLEAVVESSKIAAKGFESIGQSAAEYGRASFEKTSATFKSFASVKSPAEFLQLQSELVTSTFDAIASESAKTSEAMLKLVGEIAQPISSRVAVVSDKFKALAV